MLKQYGYEIREKGTEFLAGDDGGIYFQKGSAGEVWDFLWGAVPVEADGADSGGLVCETVHPDGAGDLFSEGSDVCPDGGNSVPEE